MKDLIEENGITYEFNGEVYYPMLMLSDETQYPIGKYGRMYLEFIKKHRKGTYITLLTTCKLNEHLHMVDVRVKEQVRTITIQLAQSRGIDEVLKEADPICWVREMTNCKTSAEEVVLQDVIY